ncbi:methylosome subunit pICln [Exaiptasia diaphana]|uniref:Methylosome subunit pICln n=1 Tax=Exaiptasia diaphana TaxID=2652724 RepID=A0A913XQH2_EXADI|nr:methylosome subunit pICln [Exaiptasia diaphana]KXJ25172.1 Methylosome subunit pICln [Exaiptasia diaphana]
MVIMSSLPPPSQGVRHVQNNTQAFIDENCLGNGTLYVTEERLSWSNDEGRGFSLEYPSISVHAVCKDTSKFPHECIYCMLDAPLEDCSEDDEDAKVGEVRFVPEDKESLQQIFNVLSDCQALHPDPQEEAEEEMAGFGGEYFTNEDEAELTEEGQATLQRLEGVFQEQSDPQTMVINTSTNGAGQNGQNHHSDVEMDEEDQFEDA